MVVPESQIRALIRLLSDEDDRIVRTISGKLIDIGPTAVPLLQEAEIEQPEMAGRVASVLEEIRWSKLEDELIELAELPEQAISLERGAFLIARYAYPTLDVSSYRRELDRMAQEVRARIGLRASGEETVIQENPRSRPVRATGQEWGRAVEHRHSNNLKETATRIEPCPKGYQTDPDAARFRNYSTTAARSASIDFSAETTINSRVSMSPCDNFPARRRPLIATRSFFHSARFDISLSPRHQDLTFEL